MVSWLPLKDTYKSQGCQDFLGTTYQNRKNIPKGPQNLPMFIKCMKRQLNRPHGHDIARHSKIYPKLGFFKIYRLATLASRTIYWAKPIDRTEYIHTYLLMDVPPWRRGFLGTMLWSQFSAIFDNFLRKNWSFSQKPMLWSNLIN
jgi:hypothetical protein